MERNGRFWIEDIPIPKGTNRLTITAGDNWGHSSVTNLNIISSDKKLTIDPVDPQLFILGKITVTGTVSDTNCDVTVNGVSAVVDAQGKWRADGVPVARHTTAEIQVQATPRD